MIDFIYRKERENSEDSLSQAIKAQYERYPYPRVPLLARVSVRNSYLMNYEANVYAAFGSVSGASENPRVLVAGAGSFEPCVVALANPKAEVVAVDISAASLARLRLHLWRHGLQRRVELVQTNLLDIAQSGGKFDFIIATGVLHHLEKPEQGLRKLQEVLAPEGVMRLMLYSRFGRSQVYRIRDFCRAANIRDAKLLRAVIKRLPSTHPLKAHFHLYGDSTTDEGVMDGFLHACDTGFDALEIASLLERQGLVATKFLHPEGSRPKDLSTLLAASPNLAARGANLDEWEALAVMDRLRILETNFHFIARKIDAHANRAIGRDSRRKIILNPTLASTLANPFAKILARKIYSRLDRRYLPLPPEMGPLSKGGIFREAFEARVGAEQLALYLENLILLETELP